MKVLLPALVGAAVWSLFYAAAGLVPGAMALSPLKWGLGALVVGLLAVRRRVPGWVVVLEGALAATLGFYPLAAWFLAFWLSRGATPWRRALEAPLVACLPLLARIAPSELVSWQGVVVVACGAGLRGFTNGPTPARSTPAPAGGPGPTA